MGAALLGLVVAGTALVGEAGDECPLGTPAVTVGARVEGQTVVGLLLGMRVVGLLVLGPTVGAPLTGMVVTGAVIVGKAEIGSPRDGEGVVGVAI